MNRIELTMTENYADYWGVPQGIRELYANAMDKVGGDHSQITVHYEPETSTLTIENASEEKMPLNALVLGESNKDDDAIGRFGEGMKLAYAVLLREHRRVKTVNVTETWTPAVEYSEVFDSNVVAVTITELEEPVGVVRHEIECTPDEVRSFMENCSHYHQYVYGVEAERVPTSYGDVLIGSHTSGNIYVGGMYVCDSMYHSIGFDIKPEFARLTRDRNSIEAHGYITDYMAIEAFKSSKENFERFMCDESITARLLKLRVSNLNDAHFAEESKEALTEIIDSTVDKMVEAFKESPLLTYYGPEESFAVTGNLNKMVLKLKRGIFARFHARMKELGMDGRMIYTAMPEYGMTVTGGVAYIKENVPADYRDQRIEMFLGNCDNWNRYGLPVLDSEGNVND